jgi:IS4 transposase
VAHSTPADAKRWRDWRIDHDLAQSLITRARRLYASESLGLELFVTRAKAGLRVDRLESPPVEENTGVGGDPIVWLTLIKSVKHYPDRFRRVSYRDPETGQALVFLTHNFDLPPLTIARLYRSRWRVELFFKWVQQNWRIKHFFGTSDNAVKTQVWIAICVYVLAAIVRKGLGLELSLSQILQVLGSSTFSVESVAWDLEFAGHEVEHGQ